MKQWAQQKSFLMLMSLFSYVWSRVLIAVYYFIVLIYHYLIELHCEYSFMFRCICYSQILIHPLQKGELLVGMTHSSCEPRNVFLWFGSNPVTEELFLRLNYLSTSWQHYGLKTWISHFLQKEPFPFYPKTCHLQTINYSGWGPRPWNQTICLIVYSFGHLLCAFGQRTSDL